jgi:hypothetical protein
MLFTISWSTFLQVGRRKAEYNNTKMYSAKFGNDNSIGAKLQSAKKTRLHLLG